MKNKLGDYEGLADLTDGKGNKINLSDITKTNFNSDTKTKAKTIQNPNVLDKYKGKNWDELYRSNELETIRTKHPEHYEKLRKEKYNF